MSTNKIPPGLDKIPPGLAREAGPRPGAIRRALLAQAQEALASGQWALARSLAQLAGEDPEQI